MPKNNKATMGVSGERLTVGKSSKRNEEDHVARYEFVLPLVQNKKVLDIACGTGFGSAMLAKKANQVIGIDIDQDSISFANENHSGSNIEYGVGNAANIKYPGAYFDVVVSFETIEHLEDVDRASYLKELHRVTKDEGIIFISTPNKIITSPWKDTPNNPFHVLEFTESLLVKELSAAGLAIDTLYGQRRVRKLLTYFLVRKFIRVVEKLLRRDFKIYDWADSAKVMECTPNYEPRYFVAKVRKNI